MHPLLQPYPCFTQSSYDMLRGLLETPDLHRVCVVISMLDGIRDERLREQKLKALENMDWFYKGAIDEGAQNTPYDGTQDGAWSILKQLLSTIPRSAAPQRMDTLPVPRIVTAAPSSSRITEPIPRRAREEMARQREAEQELEMRRRMAEASEKRREAEEEVKRMQREVEEAQKKQQKAEEDARESQRKAKDQMAERGEIDAKLDALSQGMKQLSSAQVEHLKMIRELQKENTDLRQDLNILKAAHSQLIEMSERTDTLVKAEAQSRTRNQEFMNERLTAVERAGENLLAQLNDKKALKKELDSLKASNATMQHRLRDQQEMIQRLEAQVTCH